VNEIGEYEVCIEMNRKRRVCKYVVCF